MLFRNVPYLGTSNCISKRARHSRSQYSSRALACVRQLSALGSISSGKRARRSTLLCPPPFSRARTEKRKRRRRISDDDRSAKHSATAARTLRDGVTARSRVTSSKISGVFLPRHRHTLFIKHRDVQGDSLRCSHPLLRVGFSVFYFTRPMDS